MKNFVFTEVKVKALANIHKLLIDFVPQIHPGGVGVLDFKEGGQD